MAWSKYETHIAPKLKLIEAWSRDGLTFDQISKNLRISRASLSQYRKIHSEVSNALQKGRDEADIEVENSLYKRALGYRYDEVTYENGEETKRVTKEVHPDVTAQIYWLKNRKPDQWRERRDALAEEKDKGNIDQLTEAIIKSAEQLQKDPTTR